jgi:hypothetical protein
LAGIRKNTSQPPGPDAAAGEQNMSAAERPEAADATGPSGVKSGPNAMILAPVFLLEVAWLLLLVYLGWRLLSQL